MKRLKWWTGMLVAAVVWGAGTALAGQEMATARGMQKLVFDANGGTCNTGYDYYTQGEPYTFLPEAVWSGHEFLGWFTAASGGMQVTEAQTVTSASTRTLYAHWTPDSATPTMQKLIFNANGGTCNTSWDWYTVGQPYTYLPEANRSGYVLAGWFTASSGGMQVTEAQTVTAVEERTLYAHWTETQGESALVNGVTWSYSVANGKATVTGANPATGSLTIPSTLGGYPVTTIGEKAFVNCHDLLSVTIPACVTTIEILSSLRDAVEAFDSDVDISPTLSFAFKGCSGLTDIHVSGGNPVYASKGGVLFTKDGKTLLFCPNGKTGSYSVPDGVSQIGDGEAYFGHYLYVWGWPAFAGCTKLSNVTIPDGVEVIDDRALAGCDGLTSIAIPDSVTSIGNDAFGGCSGLAAISFGRNLASIGEGAFWGCDSLTAVHIRDLAAWCKVSYYPYGDTPLSCAHHLFLDGKEVTDLVIPDGVTSIGRNAFRGCSGLTSVTIPDSATCIGDNAFSSCSGLTSATIGNGVTNIGDSAFAYCVGLTRVTMGISITDIGWGAFSGCSGLTSLTIPASVTGIGSGAFGECDALQTLYVPESWKTKYVQEWSGDNVFWRDYAEVPEGCTVVYGLPSPQLELAGTERSFTADAANGKLVGVSANVPWTATANVSWLTVTTASGTGNGNVTYNVAANTGTGSRTGKITVSGGGLTRRFTVTQAGMTVTLALGADSRAFTAAAASGKLLTVTANVPWTAKSSASWLTVKTASGTGNGNISYNLAANTGATSRTGTITVRGGGLTRTFTVKQSGIAVTLTLEADSRTFTAAAASGKLLAVTANVAWTAKSGSSWLTVKTTGGSGSGNIEYAVAANTGTASRTATITVVGGGISRSFTVTQGGKTDGGGTAAALSLKSSSRSFTADAASGKEMSVMANVSWTAKSSASWLALKTAKGSGNGKVVYNVAANTGTASRTATITVSGGGLSRTFTVTQSGKSGGGGTAASLSLKSSSRSFTADAANGKEMSVMANVAWTAKSSASWLVVKTAKGSGNGKVSYAVAANTGTASRSATITVSGGGLTRTFTVIQSGKARSARAKAAKPQVWVTTSDGSGGAAVADGDEATGWSPSGADGSWVALTFEEERDVGAVEVIGERLPEGMRVLVSEDGDHWSEEGGEAVSYLWLLLPGEGGVPTVREIATEP